MSKPTPTRHGNWHMVNGQLVDLDRQPKRSPKPARETKPEPDAEKSEAAEAAATGKTHRTSTSKE